jgi:hypothetical protein
VKEQTMRSALPVLYQPAPFQPAMLVRSPTGWQFAFDREATNKIITAGAVLALIWLAMRK